MHGCTNQFAYICGNKLYAQIYSLFLIDYSRPMNDDTRGAAAATTTRGGGGRIRRVRWNIAGYVTSTTYADLSNDPVGLFALLILGCYSCYCCGLVLDRGQCGLSFWCGKYLPTLRHDMTHRFATVRYRAYIHNYCYNL